MNCSGAALCPAYPVIPSGKTDYQIIILQQMPAAPEQFIIRIQYKEWEVVATHNAEGEYGHQHHIMTHESVAKQFESTGCQADLYWFGTYYANDKVPDDLVEMDKSAYKKQIIHLPMQQLFCFIFVPLLHYTPVCNITLPNICFQIWAAISSIKSVMGSPLDWNSQALKGIPPAAWGQRASV